MNACKKHDWQQIHHSPYGSLISTRVEWCKNCGCVQTRTLYCEIGRHHLERLTPTYVVDE